MGRPAVIKTRRFGYDGQGQGNIRDRDDLDQAWDAIGGKPAILEGFVTFNREISVIAARGVEAQSHAPTSPRTSTAITSSKIRARRRRSRGKARSMRERIGERLAHALDLSACSRSRCSSAKDGGLSCQRDRAARAQSRPLDDRRRLDLAVRAAHPRGRRLAAGLAGRHGARSR